MRFKKIFFLVSICGGILLSACNPVKNIPEGKSLLVKNKIITDTTILTKDRFEKFIKQKPNRKIIGLFRFHLGLYNLGKDSSWLRNIGEEPVILDSEMINRSKAQIKLFLYKNGFFNASVDDSVEFRKKKIKLFLYKFGFFKASISDSVHKKKTEVSYYIKYGPAYTNRMLSYYTQDTGISPLMSQCQKTAILIPGDRYSEDQIEKERERITSDLKDKGYYFFNRNYITFQIDTALGTHQADISLYLNRINENVSSSNYSVPILDHQTYKLRNIYIQTDYNPKDPSSSIPRDTTIYNGYYIISSNKYRVLKDKVLVNNLFIKPGDNYLQRDLDMTYKKLQELNIFKFINLYFNEVPRDSIQREYLLDLQIQLTPMDKMDFTEDFELTNTGSNIGIAGSLGFRNKNIFRGAEVLEVKLKGGLEAIPNTKSTETTNKFLVFNTFEIGPEASLSFKKLLGFKHISRYSNPNTKISLGYNHQNSPDYDRTITNFGFGWSLSPTSKQRLSFYPVEINSVVVKLSPSFQQELNDLQDPQLSYAYETHLISSFRMSWFTTSKSANSQKDFVYFRTNFECAVKVFDQKFNPSEFVKIDYDFSYYHNINKYNTLVSRINMGYGLPYGSSIALPFEKSFFGGGANSMRAWYTRTLGPGSFRKTIDVEQSGDIKMEGNVEFRNEIFQFSNGMKLEGASFVDVGNIWTRNEDISRPGGQFKVDKFISELGIGAGLGLRFNFSFFIFRIDAAVKLRDPSLDEGDRWVYPKQKFGISDVTPSLAIGYPF